VIVSRRVPLGDGLVFDGRLEHHAFVKLRHHVTLDFLPRRLMLGNWKSALFRQHLESLFEFGIVDQNIGLTTVEIDADLVIGLQHSQTTTRRSFGDALRIDGDPLVPDWRPSPIQGKAKMPRLMR